MAVYFPTEDTHLNIARGLVKDTFDVHKFGANPSLGNGSANIETIWDGSNLYPWSSFGSGSLLYLKSSSSSDTSRQIEIQGLDTNWDLQTETVTLDGTDPTATAVVTENQFIRVFRMRNTGSTDVIGNITAKVTSASGTTVAQITDGNNQTLMCVYSVPRNYKAYLLNLESCSAKNEEITIKFFIRNFGGVFRLQHQAKFTAAQYNYNFTIPLEFDAKSDIDFRAFAGNTGVDITGTFNLVLIKQPIGS